MASLSKCGHVFHYSCIENYISKNQKCLVCNKKCGLGDIVKIIYNIDDIEENEGFKEEYLCEKAVLEEKNKVLQKLRQENTKIKLQEKTADKELENYQKQCCDYPDLTRLANFPQMKPNVNKSFEKCKHKLLMFDKDKYLNMDNINMTDYGPFFYKDKKCVYYGQYSAKKRHGYGILVKYSGTYISGEWHQNKLHGQVEYMSAKGDSYIGTFQYGMKEGKGIEKCRDGTTFEGNFEKGKKNGYFVAKFRGKTYEGEFKDGKCNGKGKMVWEDNRSYEGGWEDDKMHGRGTFIWLNQQKYVGEYRRGKKWGFGKISLENGYVYEGEFVDGKQHGKGKAKLTDNR